MAVKLKGVSEQAIERVRQINREHKRAVHKPKTAKEITPQRERVMIDSFYKNNKATHLDCKERWGESTLQRMSHD